VHTCTDKRVKPPRKFLLHNVWADTAMCYPMNRGMGLCGYNLCNLDQGTHAEAQGTSQRDGHLGATQGWKNQGNT
jgi:hypothetical protein